MKFAVGMSTDGPRTSPACSRGIRDGCRADFRLGCRSLVQLLLDKEEEAGGAQQPLSAAAFATWWTTRHKNYSTELFFLDRRTKTVRGTLGQMRARMSRLRLQKARRNVASPPSLGTEKAILSTGLRPKGWSGTLLVNTRCRGGARASVSKRMVFRRIKTNPHFK